MRLDSFDAAAVLVATCEAVKRLGVLSEPKPGRALCLTKLKGSQKGKELGKGGTLGIGPVMYDMGYFLGTL